MLSCKGKVVAGGGGSGRQKQLEELPGGGIKQTKARKGVGGNTRITFSSSSSTSPSHGVGLVNDLPS